MKKIILSTLIIVGLNFIAHSQVLMNQGVIAFDDSVGSPNVYINGVLDTSTDINAELLYSTSGPFGAYQPVVTLLLSDTTPIYGTFHYGVVEPAAGDVSIFATGQLYDISGNTYQDPANPPGTVENFIVEGWLGNYSSYTAALYAGAGVGITAPFTETLSAPANPIIANLSNMPILDIITPEPATLALAGLGLASLLAVRRRK